MDIPTKKLKSGFEMPIYGLGTWKMGGTKIYDPNNDDQADIQAIKTAIENGITHIDTAENYAEGYTETLVGKAIKDYERSKLFLVSKVAPEHLQYEDVINALKASLKRLQTNYLDLYLIHAPNPDIPLKETMRAMDTLLEEGLIKNIGICNFTIAEFEEAQSYTKNKIVINQLHLNLKYREAERKGLLEYCQKNDVLFVAWRPLQKGILIEGTENIVNELAQKYQKTPAQIALNWLISQPNVVTLSKTRDVEHLKDNLGALNWIMDTEDIERLDKEYPNQEDISDAVPLH
jgi:diketogulonate reductase-like aldo/keto reductase